MITFHVCASHYEKQERVSRERYFRVPIRRPISPEAAEALVALEEWFNNIPNLDVHISIDPKHYKRIK